MMKVRPRAWVALALLALAFVFGDSQTALTLPAQIEVGAATEFILRAPADRIAAVATRYGLTIVRQIEGHPDVFLVRRTLTPPAGSFQIFSFTSAATSGDSNTLQELTNEVLSDPDVLHFEINGSAIITETQAAPRLDDSTVAILDSLSNRTTTNYFGTTVWQLYPTQPALGLIRLADAQQLASGTGVVVAIIDTGVDPHHPALAGSLVSGYDFTRDLAGPASEWTDLDDSTVAILDSATGSILDPSAPVSLNDSTVAILDQPTAARLDISSLPQAFGHGTMVAGLVHVVAPSARIMALKAFKADGSATLFNIERAIYYAVDHGAKVINMSFSMADWSTEITHAIDYATQHGVICLASAGNSARSSIVYPAAFRNVIGIGSTTLADERSNFTNYGDHLVEFAAPGEMLLTLYPGRRYANVSGTSFSTALVTGGAALLSQLEPALDARLASRFLDDGSLKRSTLELGDGRIDLFASVRNHTATLPPPPPPVDSVAPTVTLTSPAPGAVIAGLFPLAANASDDVAVVGLRFTIDNAALGAEHTAAPYALNWDTATVPNGVHVLTAVARDAAGNHQTASVSVTVANDTTAPTVAMTSPAGDTTIAGLVAVRASASDDVRVIGVAFFADGAEIDPQHAGPAYARTWDSRTVPNGLHVLTAVARDAAGNQQTASVSVTVANDAAAPTVAVANPAEGATITGVITLGASASDDIGVLGVRFSVDGAAVGDEQAAPYALAWNSLTVPNGPHVLAAVARDAAGRQQTASVSVTVSNDIAAPTVALTSPVEGAPLSGFVALRASASDDIGVVGVQFSVDGAALGDEQAAPYALTWDSVTAPNGTHLLTAVARDAAGHQQTASVSVTVTNDITAPTVAVTSPAEAAAIAGLITLGANASDDIGVVGVQFAVDNAPVGAEHLAAPYAQTWNSLTVPNGMHVLTAIARDAAGHQHTASVSVAVANDTTAPAVALTNPAEGATIAGLVTVGSDASDNVGVVGVQFAVDGTALGAEHVAAPYALTWNSLTVPNGVHLLTAIARDAAGNQQSASVSVTVANDITAPTVVLSNPAEGATIAGLVTLGASASDDVGVAGVQFAVDGAALEGEQAAPYTISWDSAAVPDGLHVLTAVARDAAGHQQTASASVIVANSQP